jgi:monofunctional chorismate mutase
MSTRLDQDRAAIDEIDQEIARLFEKRFGIVEDVIRYKIENRLPILDSDREEEITKKNAERIQNEDIRPYFRRLYADLLKLSREYQKEILDSQ